MGPSGRGNYAKGNYLRESLFKNELYELTMQEQNVKVSRGSAEAFQNQAMESLNRTIKGTLKNIIAVQEGVTDLKVIQKKQIRRIGNIQPQQMEVYIKKAIEVYNNKKHNKLNGLSPNQMEEALFHRNKNAHPDKKEMITKEGTIEDASMKVYQALVIQEYKGDWQRFRMDNATKPTT